MTLDIGKPTRAEQRALWKIVARRGGAHLNGSVDRITAQFNFDTASIRAACAHSRAGADGGRRFKQRTLGKLPRRRRAPASMNWLNR